MLILHTPKGKIPVAKDNIHTIHEEDKGPFLKPRLIYVTRDLIGIPFTKINGKAINGIPVTSAKQGMEVIKDASKPFNRIKNSTIRTFNKLKIKRRIKQ